MGRSEESRKKGWCCKKEGGHKRRLTSHVSGESLGQPPSVGSGLHARKNSRLSHGKEEGLFREIHTPQTGCGPSQKARDSRYRVVSLNRAG